MQYYEVFHRGIAQIQWTALQDISKDGENNDIALSMQPM